MYPISLEPSPDPRYHESSASNHKVFCGNEYKQHSWIHVCVQKETAAIEQVQKGLQILEKHLAKQTYLVGDSVTLADIITFANLLNGYQNVSRSSPNLYNCTMDHSQSFFNLIHVSTPTKLIVCKLWDVSKESARTMSFQFIEALQCIAFTPFCKNSTSLLYIG